MAINCIQVNLLRRVVLLLLTLSLLGCIASQPYPSSELITQPNPIPKIRQPKVGQEWVYIVRNVFNQTIVDTVTERVVSVGKEVRIERTGAKLGPLPDEVQSPWGYVLQDPHWNPPQKFFTPLPLWPEKLSADWKGSYKTRYIVVGYPDFDFYWGLNIEALGWEKVIAPAGQFVTLKYRNDIPFFQSNDIFRVASIREEDAWFSPEIGRWVIRRGYGRYLLAGVFWNNALWEDYLEWELISWKQVKRLK